jgi:MtaA/CmuA family methyltransferase
MVESQTPRERVLSVLRGEQADRPPVTPTGGWWVARASGLPLPEIFANGEALAAAHLDVQRRAGYDAVYTYFDALAVPEAFGCRVELKEFGGPSIAEELSLEGAGMLDRPIPDPRRDGRLPEILKAAAILAERTRGALPVMGLFEGPFTTASRLLGATTFLLVMMDDPALARRIIAKAADALIAFGRALAQSGADAIIMPDPVSSTDLVSPGQSAEFAFPEIRRVIASLPVPVILHICGKTLPILGAMASSGARLLSLDQAVDLREARQVVGWRVALGGNVDPVRLMERGTPAEVTAAGRAAIAAAGPGQFCLMAGCALPPATPLENVRALVAAAHPAAAGGGDEG